MTQQPRQPYGWYAPEDPKRYELACLEAVQRALAGVEEMPSYREVPKIIHEVALRGEYPETELVVDVERANERDVLAWRLHGDDFGTPQVPGYQQWPHGVADDVLIQVLEYGR
jgi:hypothetical protein